MNRRVLITTAFVGLLCVSTVFAQDGASFSGTWLKDAEASESLAQAPAAAARAPLRLVIEQVPNGVQVTRERLNGLSETLTYSFNPTHSAAPVATAGQAAPTVPRAGTSAVAKKEGTDAAAQPADGATDAQAEWKDGGLMLATTMMVSGKAVTTTELLTMSADSRKLTVETNLMVHHGYESVGGVATASSGSNMKDVYTKTVAETTRSPKE
jgi:hypothetical protein